MPATTQTQHLLKVYTDELTTELSAILSYWKQHAVDETNGGFWGKVNNLNVHDDTADKGVVLTARILWTFSAAFQLTGETADLGMAERAFHYLDQHFRDNLYGGVYWSVNAKGTMRDSRKQIYGLAFAIYGLSEYYAASGNREALTFAKDLYQTIEQHSFDVENNGYYEAFARNWQPLQDLRLSAKDANASKTMNTHLHIIEAYSNLYKVWKNEELKQKIANLLALFHEHFIHKDSGHLALFFSDAWLQQPDVISYGHDIEAAWLLLQCAETTGSQHWIPVYRQYAISIASAASEGIDTDGGMWYEYDPARQQLIKEKHWWVQAEAMIGFMNAWQISGDEKYLRQSLRAWQFIKQHILDKENGEWFWGVDEHYQIMPGEDKAGFWKCPYHNARACMELISRTDNLPHHL